MKVALRLTVVLLTVAVLQRGLFSQLRIVGVAADVFLLVAIAAGITGGPDRGAIVGFFAGLAFDLLVVSPLGLGALAYCLTGFIAGTVEGAVVRSSKVFPVVISIGATALGVTLYALFAVVVGRANPFNGHLPTIILVTSLANGLLCPLALRAMRWVWAADESLRPAVR